MKNFEDNESLGIKPENKPEAQSMWVPDGTPTERKKVLIQTQFGTPHTWTTEYFRNVRMLEPLGWSLKVFTPNLWKSAGNIEIIPMTIEGFDALVKRYCGVEPKNFIDPTGRPHKLVSDFYPAYGLIFQDYIRGFDFWAHTNWDMVYGRLDRYIPDVMLDQVDIWSDDVDAINGIFTVYRNNEFVNNLFRRAPGWEMAFTLHEECAFDEYQMTQAVRQAARDNLVRFAYPLYFGMHSYDRLLPHVPTPQVYFEDDGGLCEILGDVNRAAPRGFFGREIMSFHFSRTKKWPVVAKPVFEKFNPAEAVTK